MKTKRYKFRDIVQGDEGLLKGPFGSDLKKSLYIPKDKTAYKVYLQENILKRDKSYGYHYISEQYFNRSMKRYEVKDDDFIVTCDGTLGEIFQLRNIKERGIISSSLLRITLNKQLVDDIFFPYFWLSRIKYPLIRSHNNSVLKHLPGLKVIKEFEFDLPQLEDQQKIAKVLSAIDSKIELNNNINGVLLSLAKNIYEYWFVQFDFPDENGKPYKTSGGKMKWNNELKREIPENWTVEKLKKIVKCNYKTISKSNQLNQINYLDTSNLTENVIDSIQKINLDSEKLPSRAQRIVEHNDILYSTVRPNQHHFGIVKNPAENLIASTGFAQITSIRENIKNEFLYLFLTSEYNMNHLQKIADSSVSSYPSISPNDILNLFIAIPTNEFYIINICSILEPIFEKIASSQKQNKELVEIRDWLLPMLMNGQVTVKGENKSIPANTSELVQQEVLPI